MFLHEYQSKQYFERFGIPVLAGKTALSPSEAAVIAAEFGAPVVVNAQSLSSTRVFRLAQTPKDAEYAARDILAMTISGVRVRTVLVEPATETTAEYLLGIYGNRGSSLLLFASSEGGTDLSQIERTKPNTLFRELISPFLGVLDFQARNLASSLNLPRETWSAFTQIAMNLYRCAVASDAVRAEINPLGMTQEGKLIALGGRLVIDDNALFRQPEIAALRDIQAEHETTVQARTSGITYIHLSGRIGCILSGAGLGMATIDLLALHNAPASSFIDLGSDVRRDKISAALRLILPDAEAVLFNIFADRTPCDQIAEELIAALTETQPDVPLVIRLVGHEADRGEALLQAANLPNLSTASTTSDAVQLVAAALKV
ncbi:MAG: ATP-grasp domain-containing protein [Chloroflexota bacterium]